MFRAYAEPGTEGEAPPPPVDEEDGDKHDVFLVPSSFPSASRRDENTPPETYGERVRDDDVVIVSSGSDSSDGERKRRKRKREKKEKKKKKRRHRSPSDEAPPKKRAVTVTMARRWEFLKRPAVEWTLTDSYLVLDKSFDPILLAKGTANDKTSKHRPVHTVMVDGGASSARDLRQVRFSATKATDGRFWQIRMKRHRLEHVFRDRAADLKVGHLDYIRFSDGPAPENKESIELEQRAAKEEDDNLAEGPAHRRALELNKRVSRDPKDVDAWLEFVAIQPEVAQESVHGGTKTGTNAAVAERQLAILDQALKHNARSERLAVARVNLVAKTSTTTVQAMASEWDRVHSQHPDWLEAWWADLDSLLFDLQLYNVELIAKRVSLCLSKLIGLAEGTLRSHQPPQGLNAFLIRVARRQIWMWIESGHVERAVAYAQGLIELNVFAGASRAATAETVAAIKEWWERGVPRIGETNSKGWCHSTTVTQEQAKQWEEDEANAETSAYLEAERKELGAAVALGAADARLWRTAERLRHDMLWRPLRLENLDEEDGDRFVRWSQHIRPVLFVAPIQERDRLVKSMLGALGVVDWSLDTRQSDEAPPLIGARYGFLDTAEWPWPASESYRAFLDRLQDQIARQLPHLKEQLLLSRLATQLEHLRVDVRMDVAARRASAQSFVSKLIAEQAANPDERAALRLCFASMMSSPSTWLAWCPSETVPRWQHVFLGKAKKGSPSPCRYPICALPVDNIASTSTALLFNQKLVTTGTLILMGEQHEEEEGRGLSPSTPHLHIQLRAVLWMLSTGALTREQRRQLLARFAINGRLGRETLADAKPTTDGGDPQKSAPSVHAEFLRSINIWMTFAAELQRRAQLHQESASRKAQFPSIRCLVSAVLFYVMYERDGAVTKELVEQHAALSAKLDDLAERSLLAQHICTLLLLNKRERSGEAGGARMWTQIERLRAVAGTSSFLDRAIAARNCDQLRAAEQRALFRRQLEQVDSQDVSAQTAAVLAALRLETNRLARAAAYQFDELGITSLSPATAAQTKWNGATRAAFIHLRETVDAITERRTQDHSIVPQLRLRLEAAFGDQNSFKHAVTTFVVAAPFAVRSIALLQSTLTPEDEGAWREALQIARQTKARIRCLPDEVAVFKEAFAATTDQPMQPQ